MSQAQIAFNALQDVKVVIQQINVINVILYQAILIQLLLEMLA